MPRAGSPVPSSRTSKGSTACGKQLFQRDLAHGLVTHDLADFQTLDCELALLVFSPN